MPILNQTLYSVYVSFQRMLMSIVMDTTLSSNSSKAGQMISSAWLKTIGISQIFLQLTALVVYYGLSIRQFSNLWNLLETWKQIFLSTLKWICKASTAKTLFPSCSLITKHSTWKKPKNFMILRFTASYLATFCTIWRCGKWSKKKRLCKIINFLDFTVLICKADLGSQFHLECWESIVLAEKNACLAFLQSQYNNIKYYYSC